MSASIWNLRPLARAIERKHFTDPEQPEWPGITLTLAGMEGVRATRYAILKADITAKHVMGIRGADGKIEKPAEPVLCLDFSRRTPDELVIDRYAKLAAMWAGEEECPPLSEVVGWQALLYIGWLEIANWIEEVYTRTLLAASGEGEASAADEEGAEGGAEGNSPPPATRAPAQASPIGHSSEASSDLTAATTSTPNSPSEETPCSVLSSEASGLLPAFSEPAAAR